MLESIHPSYCYAIDWQAIIIYTDHQSSKGNSSKYFLL